MGPIKFLTPASVDKQMGERTEAEDSGRRLTTSVFDVQTLSESFNSLFPTSVRSRHLVRHGVIEFLAHPADAQPGSDIDGHRNTTMNFRTIAVLKETTATPVTDGDQSEQSSERHAHSGG